LRRALAQGVELDDDRRRIDSDAVYRYLKEESYWARGRSRQDVLRSIRDAARVVGLYQAERMIGFARVISDGVHVAHLCDVYVLPEFRGRGFGVELVREAVDNGPHADLGWSLATKDAHGLYERFGFAPPDREVMQRKRMP
jgi:ribosomal protein S18 acetylase RimI-like enzyme